MLIVLLLFSMGKEFLYSDSVVVIVYLCDVKIILQQLNLPDIELKITDEGGSALVFDILRKKYVRLTPEEWVRQHIIHYFIHQLGYPAGLIAVEMQIRLNRMVRRCDIIVFDNAGNPLMVTECKSFTMPLTLNAFEQVIRYNSVLKVNYIAVSNGLDHYCCRMSSDGSWEYLPAFPAYHALFG